MEDILKSLGYSSEVVDTFKREGVTTEAVLGLHMSDLERLGITGIGRQAILRGRCRRVESFSRAPGPSGRQGHIQVTGQHTRQLFAPYNSRNGKKRTSTFSLPFLCLSSKSSFCSGTGSLYTSSCDGCESVGQLLKSRVPSVFTQKTLKECGLGEKKLTFPSSSSPEEVISCIYTNFPKLKDGGGFEYVKAEGSTKMFIEIPLPEGGFNAVNLKAAAKGSRIYLRPVQADLDMTAVAQDNTGFHYETLHKCHNCNEMIAQTKLRTHVRICQKPEEQQSTPEDSEDDIVLLSDPFEETNIETREDPTTANAPNSSTYSSPTPSSSTLTVTQEGSGRNKRLTTVPLQSSLTSNSSGCYNEYANLLDSIDEDPADPDLDEIDAGIIEESLLDFDNNNVAQEALMQQRITEFQDENKSKEEPVTVVVRRSRIVHTTVLATASKQPSFFLKDLVVNFSGEEATDLGGPKREFFRLLMDNLPFLRVFEGHPPKLYFSHDLELLQVQRYRLAGRFVSWCIIHNGPGFPYFHPAIFDMMCYGSSQEKLCVEDIGDYEVAERLKRIHQCTSQEDLDDAVKDIGDWAADMGCNNIYSLQVSEKDTVIDSLMKQHMYYRSKTEMEQFTQGLEDVGSFWTIVKNDWRAFRGLFTNGKKPLTLSSLRLLFKYHKTDDPRRKEEEEDTIFSWEQLLARCDAGECTIGLRDILAFATGADTIPPLGFDKQIDVHFYSPAEQSKNYPIACTCPMELHLPRNASDADSFCKNFVEAVLWSPGYGKK